MNFETNNNLPGLMNLYAFSPKSADVIRPLLNTVLYDKDFSPIPVGQRMALAAKHFFNDDCWFLWYLHKAIATAMLGGEFDRIFKGDFDKEEPEKIEGLSKIQYTVQYDSWGHSSTPEAIKEAMANFGLSDREIHDTILICSVCDMLITYLGYSGCYDPDGMDGDKYAKLAMAIVLEGYNEGTFKHLNC